MTEKQKAKLEQEKLRAAGMRAFEQEAAGQYGKDGLICLRRIIRIECIL